MKKSLKHYRLHRFLMRLMRILASPVVKRVVGYQCVREKGPETPSMIISNHNTDLDPALVGMGFTGHMYFVASEHAFRKGILSMFLKFVFDPIPINKLKAEASTLREILHRSKAGASVCIFAEGNRSNNGLTGPIPFSMARLVKMSGAALITFRLEGGYLTTPRWGKVRRKGEIRGSVTGRYSALELKAMTSEQVLDVITEGTYENAFERQRERPVRFLGEDLAENIEIVLYLCPRCKKIGTIHSHGNRFSCDCGLNGEYMETGFLEGEELPFSTIADWDQWQSGELALMVSKAGDEPICADDNQKLYKILPASGNILVGEGSMLISRSELRCAGRVFPLQEITRLVIVDRMTLDFETRDGTPYEILSDTPRSALKYLEIYNRLTMSKEQ